MQPPTSAWPRPRGTVPVAQCRRLAALRTQRGWHPPEYPNEPESGHGKASNQSIKKIKRSIKVEKIKKSCNSDNKIIKKIKKSLPTGSDSSKKGRRPSCGGAANPTEK
ncbi:MAG: hypothetical protein NTW21_32175 [Verrucomicrobia bacterium]|nr:hypothetical protein [Verrucomicrobiota bacterium]